MQVTQKELADALGLTTRWVRQLASDNGIFTPKPDKKYNLAECVQEYIDFKLESTDKGGSDREFLLEKAWHEEAKRKITQMKLARMKRETFDASDVEDVWAELILNFKEELQSVPHKLAPMIIGVDDMTEIARMFENEINTALLALSNFDLSKIKNDDYYGEDEDDEEEYTKGSATPVAASSPRKKSAGKRVERRIS